MSDPILLERRGAVAHLVLNRPDKLNAFDDAMVRRLHTLIAEADADPSVRAVVLRGEGRAFCAGADLEAVEVLRAEAGAFAAFAAFLERWHAAFDAVERCAKPTIAAVHGFALAGGFELTLACDLVVLAEDARLGDQHARYGLFPGGGSTQRLPRLIGRRQALWLLLSGEWIGAEQALAFGLVNEVVPAERVVERAGEMAELLSARSPLASAAIKQAVRLGTQVGLDQALAMERPAALRHMESEDAAIGIQAFKDRSEPKFKDR